MAATANAYNCTDAPVVIDGDGHRLDGKTHGKVDAGLPEVAAAIRAGSLVVSDHVLDRVEDDRAGADQVTAPTDSATAESAPTTKGRGR